MFLARAGLTGMVRFLPRIGRLGSLTRNQMALLCLAGMAESHPVGENKAHQREAGNQA